MIFDAAMKTSYVHLVLAKIRHSLYFFLIEQVLLDKMYNSYNFTSLYHFGL